MKLLWLFSLFVTINSYGQISKIEQIKIENVLSRSLHDGWYHISKDKNSFKRVDIKSETVYYINPEPILIPDNFKSYEVFKYKDGGQGITVYFDDFGKKRWSEATLKAIGSHLIFVFNDKIFSSPYVNAQILSGVSAFSRSGHKKGEWNKLIKLLKRSIP